MITLVFVLILLGVLSLLYFLINLRLKNRIYNTLKIKYEEYKKEGRVVLCYVDDEFAFKKDPYRYIEIDGKTFIIRGKKYNIDEVKDVKYKLETFNFKLRDSVYVKIFFDIISDVYKIDSLYIRTDYVVTFVLMIYLIKKNTLVINKEQVKELLKVKHDKTIKI